MSTTLLNYDGEYTISFEEEDVFYDGLSFTELRRVKESIEKYLTPSELETILVEHDVTSWEGAQKIGMEIMDIRLDRPPQSIRLGDYFGMTITFRTTMEIISDALAEKIRRALRNRFGSDSSQGNGAEFGRDVLVYLV